MDERNSTPSKRAAVVINPVKSPGEDFRSAFDIMCAEEGWDVPLWLETTADDAGGGQARIALEGRADVVIAAGGDGTVRCVAEVLAGTGTPMGLVPLGTGNLLARNLGVSLSDALGAARDILNGQNITIDVVKAVLDHGENERLFLVASGLGYDATLMADTKDELKDRVGWLAYVDAGIRNLPGKGVKASIKVDGHLVARRRVRGVMVGNCGKLMGGVEIFPDASFIDGLLDVLVLSPRGRFGWVGVIAGIFRHKGAQSRSVDYFSGRSAEITLDRDQDFQLDGDHLGKARHLRVTVDHQALAIRMTAPPNT
jgi:diacylglycerol kinase (ATP)